MKSTVVVRVDRSRDGVMWYREMTPAQFAAAMALRRTK
jgi:hypothetical protein